MEFSVSVRMNSALVENGFINHPVSFKGTLKNSR
jgi:hypothetical protein